MYIRLELGPVSEVKQSSDFENHNMAAKKTENRMNAMINIKEELLGEQRPGRVHEQICFILELEFKL